LDFYFFTSDFNSIKELEKIGFEGVLFVYNAISDDNFVNIARNISSETKIKHMVAIRPYVISPQYLAMISKSMDNIKKDILQINLISGHIKDEEKYVGGIVGLINDGSSKVEKSNYLIEYIKSLEGLRIKKPDYYVSATNSFTFNAAKEYGSKIIIEYSHYKKKIYDIDETKLMISITPILRKTQAEINILSEKTLQQKQNIHLFTYKEFSEMINDLKNNGINKMILSAWDIDEQNNIVNFVKEYKEKMAEEVEDKNRKLSACKGKE
jgi:hypothetical protein